MKSHGSTTLLFFFALVVMALPSLAQGTPPVTAELHADGVIWVPQHPVGGFSLTLAFAGGTETWYLGPDESIEIDLQTLQQLVDPTGGPLDGLYKWEARVLPALTAAQRASLAALRANDTRPSRGQLSALGVESPESLVSSGTFRIDGGSVVVAELEEAASSDRAEPTARSGGSSDRQLVTRDQVIQDDLIVSGSACVGQDCVNGENFGFDTIRMKENNLRIKFQDTSNSGSFPTNDWQLTANDSTNGGANKFSIDDIDSARTPFTIEAGSPNHSLYLDNSGYVGFGTSTPAVQMHLVDGNTPTLRLDQDSSAGFQRQVWDVAGNEANFFVRDVTNGSRLSFRIKPGAPEDSLFVAADGDVGLGTDTPGADLEIRNPEFVTLQMDYRVTPTAGDNRWSLIAESGRFSITSTGESADAELFLDGSGNLTTTGTVNAFSDRNAKEDFRPVDTAAVLERLVQLPISRWSYRSQPGVPHIGPMAQDFHAAFGLGNSDRHIALNDATGVSLAAVQELYRLLQQREAEIETLEKRLLELERRLDGTP